MVKDKNYRKCTGESLLEINYKSAIMDQNIGNQSVFNALNKRIDTLFVDPKTSINNSIARNGGFFEETRNFKKPNDLIMMKKGVGTNSNIFDSIWNKAKVSTYLKK